MDRYAVMGNPISHSLSPAIHAAFARATKESIEYTGLLVPLGQFAQSARRFFDEGGRGANVTLPFKLDAFDLAATKTDRAIVAGAANFLVARGGAIEADNTDGAGLVTDLTRNLGVRLEGAHILVLGAAGARIIARFWQACARVANRTGGSPSSRPRDPAIAARQRGARAIARDGTISSSMRRTSTHGKRYRSCATRCRRRLAYDQYGAGAAR